MNVFAHATALFTAALALGTCGGGDDATIFRIAYTVREPMLQGVFTLSGEVTSAVPIPRGARTTLGIARDRSAPLGELVDMTVATAPLATTSILFELRGLDRNDSLGLFLGVDLDQDQLFGAGDLVGFYDGSALAPIQSPINMRLFQVRQSTPGLNFGVGPLP